MSEFFGNAEGGRKIAKCRVSTENQTKRHRQVSFLFARARSAAGGR